MFTIVSFTWAGFVTTFASIMLLSLFWKRTNRAGAAAGICYNCPRRYSASA
ncbi:MAG TPA: hypothetical protein DEQ64_12350 [Lachnoclostridium sp.]|uniref:sodium:solute symporter family transporter n=1 Tax=Lacrimispora sp. TaxID=2719234 RepID=UPI000EC1C69C|nr:hypothetical protein [Lachnoclostridium sp.]